MQKQLGCEIRTLCSLFKIFFPVYAVLRSKHASNRNKARTLLGPQSSAHNFNFLQRHESLPAYLLSSHSQSTDRGIDTAWSPSQSRRGRSNRGGTGEPRGPSRSSRDLSSPAGTCRHLLHRSHGHYTWGLSNQLRKKNTSYGY